MASGDSRRSGAGRLHVVIVGGGFGGLYAAKSLRRVPVDVTLVDRRNFHLFQPLLYQVATGGLSPANIAAPLRSVLERQRNAHVILDEALDLDPARRVLFLRRGELAYDVLIVAAGVGHNYFGHAEWQSHAPGLKTIEEATEIRRRILGAYERAERETDPARVDAWLTFVVVGGGATGVELAGALAEIARHTLRREFRRINPARARIVLVEAGARLLPSYPGELSDAAARSLARLGVEVRLAERVTNIGADSVVVSGVGRVETIAARTVVWSAGIRGVALGRRIAERTGAELDHLARVRVQPDCSVRGHPELFVIGDLAGLDAADGRPLPGVAPVAMQQGAYVARLLARRLRGRAVGAFCYRDRGSLATIGRAAAVADFGWVRFSGIAAWLAWLFVHLVFLIEFQNRVLVLVQWAWSYLSWERSARLITGEAPPGAAHGADAEARIEHE